MLYRYQWTFRANADLNVRERIAAIVRALAQKIDGRISLAIHIETEPQIGYERTLACLQFGYRAIQSAIDDETKSALVENVMENECPYLFDPSDHG